MAPSQQKITVRTRAGTRTKQFAFLRKHRDVALSIYPLVHYCVAVLTSIRKLDNCLEKMRFPRVPFHLRTLNRDVAKVAAVGATSLYVLRYAQSRGKKAVLPHEACCVHPPNCKVWTFESAKKASCLGRIMVP